MENEKYCIVDVTLDINNHIGVVDLLLEEAEQWILENQTQLETPVTIGETTFPAQFIYKSYPLI